MACVVWPAPPTILFLQVRYLVFLSRLLMGSLHPRPAAAPRSPRSFRDPGLVPGADPCPGASCKGPPLSPSAARSPWGTVRHSSARTQGPSLPPRGARVLLPSAPTAWAGAWCLQRRSVLGPPAQLGSDCCPASRMQFTAWQSVGSRAPPRGAWMGGPTAASRSGTAAAGSGALSTRREGPGAPQPHWEMTPHSVK